MAEQRRHPRFKYFGFISISWTSHGERNHVLGRCLDVSERGVGLELPKSLPLGSNVTVHADWLSLNGLATVRRLVNRVDTFILGLEFEVPLPHDALENLLSSVGNQTTSPSPSANTPNS